MCALEIEAEAPDLEPHCSHSSELCIAIVIIEGLRLLIVMQKADPSNLTPLEILEESSRSRCAFLSYGSAN